MKKYILSLLCSIVMIAGAAAQDNNDHHGGDKDRGHKDEVDAYKIGFITRRLNLTPDEAKAFWPVYDKYQAELDEVRKKRRHDLIDAKLNFDNLSDKEVEKLVDGEIIFKQNELDILKKYHPEFKSILKPRKLALLYKAQEEFKRELLNKIRDTGGFKKEN